MSSSTLVVLLLLTLGQVLILGIGFFVLWLAGEFEDGGRGNSSASKLHLIRRLRWRARLASRQVLCRLRSAAIMGAKVRFSRIVTSLFVVAAVASSVITIKVSSERCRTA